MSRRRWIADEHDSSLSTAAITGQNAKHLSRVLRARAGQECDIVCSGRLFLARIKSVSDERVEFALEEDLGPATSSAKEVVLLLAVFKFDRMEWALEKATELGVSRIQPVIAARTDVHLAKSAPKRVVRWQKIAREAAQQSRRGQAPEILPPMALKPAIAEYGNGLRIVLSESEQAASLLDLVSAGSASVTFAVGPEGGWNQAELSAFQVAGWQAATLGTNILRAETAAIAGLALILALAKLHP